MKPTEFDITRLPMTADEIASQKQRIEIIQIKLQASVERRSRAITSIMATFGAILAGMWLLGEVDLILFATISAGAIATMVLRKKITGRPSFNDDSDVPYLGTALMLAIASISALLAATLEGEFTAPATTAMMLNIATIGACLFLTIRDHNSADALRVQAMLLNNAPLDPERNPNAYKEYVQWVDADSHVRHFQEKLSALHRRPLMGEYLAVCEWMEQQRPSS